MRELPFVKSSPCGNLTILIRNTSLSSAQRATVAAEMVAPDHLAAEQVGFVDTHGTVPRLDMMGGEFCLNATRSFATLLYTEGRLNPLEARPEWFGGTVSVSGLNFPVEVMVHPLDGLCCYEAGVKLDDPKAPFVQEVAAGLFRVDVPGITHLVIDASRYTVPVHWKEETTALLERFDLLGADAAGCIWLHGMSVLSDTALSPRAITPFVRVRATETIFAETACGSGTLAAALVCSLVQGKAQSLSFRQPGGAELTVRPAVSRFPKGWAVWVEGQVRTLAQGTVFVHSI